MYSLPKKWKNRIFEGLFWASIAVGLLLITATVVLGWRIYNSPPTEGVDVGVMLATGALPAPLQRFIYTDEQWAAGHERSH
jgi:hypothetical protein